MQTQLDWPTSALLVLYSCVVGHARHWTSPAVENWPAAQAAPQIASLAAVQFASVTEPAQDVQAPQGARPAELQVEPFTQCNAQTSLAVFQA